MKLEPKWFLKIHLKMNFRIKVKDNKIKLLEIIIGQYTYSWLWDWYRFLKQGTKKESLIIKKKMDRFDFISYGNFCLLKDFFFWDLVGKSPKRKKKISNIHISREELLFNESYKLIRRFLKKNDGKTWASFLQEDIQMANLYI